ncbi:transcriptional regulator [Chlorogloeopsis sp. ULAP01]|uniref:helix-turn-helix domain-containing protein n=1 Tax=Chlorogloeopsis sp. ULAP01 TaxID=3056483 RepID=UPI0025AB2640|nr:transcriptional regulator [Chlorogloeopsis sp. ULAP01]MDM9379276.1 transcriptional regulator [Chlorogloeopsis sp. ULAP01]
MPAIEQPKFAELIRQTRARLELSQFEFVSLFQSVNRWEKGRTKLLSLALKQIEVLVHPMDDHAKDLLEKYFQGQGVKNCEP